MMMHLYVCCMGVVPGVMRAPGVQPGQQQRDLSAKPCYALSSRKQQY